MSIPLFLFTLDTNYGSAALAAGVAGVVIDWEWRGKTERQTGFDTEINVGGPEHLARMRAAHGGHLVCRINNSQERRVQEARLAADLGADEIWLPMVRTVDEILEVLRAVNGDAEVGILVETREAMSLGRALSALPLSRVYIGLHDLRIESGGSLFDPLVDGRLARFRDTYRGALGFAGITRPDRGSPVPQRLLLAEMARLGASFGVARRAFRSDVPATEIALALSEIETEWERLSHRGEQQIAHDHAALAACVAALSGAQACAS